MIDLQLKSKRNPEVQRVLSEVRVSIRHIEIWIEEGTTASVRHHVENLLLYFEELGLLVEDELNQIHVLLRIKTMIKSVLSLFL